MALDLRSQTQTLTITSSGFHFYSPMNSDILHNVSLNIDNLLYLIYYSSLLQCCSLTYILSKLVKLVVFLNGFKCGGCFS